MRWPGQETFAQEAAAGPAGVFRNYLMGLVTLVEKGSADQVKAKAIDAFAFAHQQGWADQEVVVRMLYAGALLKEKRCDEAVKIYGGARESAAAAAAEGHPAGRQLVLQTWFGEAGAHLAAGDVDQAAACYDQAAIVAKEIPNVILTIEAYRMGMFCHARLSQRDRAIERGVSALQEADLLKPEARVMTTLPIAAIDLLRDRAGSQVDGGCKHHLVDAWRRRNMESPPRSSNSTVAHQMAFLSRLSRARRRGRKRWRSTLGVGGAHFTEVLGRGCRQRWPHSLLAPIPAEPAAADDGPPRHDARGKHGLNSRTPHCRRRRQPLPTPHMSIVRSPYIGGTVSVCGDVATAARITVVLPARIPFAPKLPGKDDELLMGSWRVADGDPFVAAVGRQVAGMISIPRLKQGAASRCAPDIQPRHSHAGCRRPPTNSDGAGSRGVHARQVQARSSRIRQKLFSNSPRFDSPQYRDG